MADSLVALAMQSGITNPKFVLIRKSDGAYWNTSGTPAFEAYNATNIASYGITATEIGSTGIYKASNPSATTSAMMLFVAAAGSSLAVSDIVSNVRYEGHAGVVRADNRNGDAVPTAAQIDTQLSNTHGNGTWEAGALSQSDINNIGDRIAETLGDNPIQIQSPATGDNTLDIVQGVDYYTADGRDIEFPFIADYVPTSCKLTLVSGTVQTVTSTDITESSGSGSGRFSVRFQIPRATGDELEAGAGTFEVLSILSNGHEVPEISEGVLTVRRRRTA